MRRALPLLLLVALVVATGEVLSHLAIVWLERRTDAVFMPVADRERELARRIGELLEAQGEALVELDGELGWRYRAGYRGPLYSSNSRGLRGTREYGPRRADVVRVAAFGNSFVHGNEVGDAQVWSAVLEDLDPRVEVLNRGIGGYGTDQALMLMRRELEVHDPEIVILGFAEMDLARNLNRFRRFLSPRDLPLSKPRFVLTPGGELHLLPNPFPDRGSWEEIRRRPRAALAAARGDAYFDSLVWRNPAYDRLASVRVLATSLPRLWRSRLGPNSIYRGGKLNPKSEGFEVTAALVEAFAQEVQDSGREFRWMVFPGRDEDIWGEGDRTYAPLLERLGHLPVIDLADALAAAPELGPENLRAPGSHYGPASNAVVGRAVGEALRSTRPRAGRR